MSPKKITFETPEGKGEATRESPDKAWEVNGPDRSFKWHGTPGQIVDEIKRRFDFKVKFLEAIDE